MANIYSCLKSAPSSCVCLDDQIQSAKLFSYKGLHLGTRQPGGHLTKSQTRSNIKRYNNERHVLIWGREIKADRSDRFGYGQVTSNIQTASRTRTRIFVSLSLSLCFVFCSVFYLSGTTTTQKVKKKKKKNFGLFIYRNQSHLSSSKLLNQRDKTATRSICSSIDQANKSIMATPDVMQREQDFLLSSPLLDPSKGFFIFYFLSLYGIILQYPDHISRRVLHFRASVRKFSCFFFVLFFIRRGCEVTWDVDWKENRISRELNWKSNSLSSPTNGYRNVNLRRLHSHYKFDPYIESNWSTISIFLILDSS